MNYTPKKIVKIGNRDVSRARGYIFDNCHKFYIIEDERDLEEAEAEATPSAVRLHPLDEGLFSDFQHSCPLRFISNWRLSVMFVPQFSRTVVFTYEDGTTARFISRD